MAKNQPLLKNPRMPPKPPRMPRNPVIINPKKRKSPSIKASVLCDGGPLHSKRMTVLALEPTMVFTLRGQRGRYIPSGRYVPTTGKHHTLKASLFSWEAVNG